jgi:hypothetical protein
MVMDRAAGGSNPLAPTRFLKDRNGGVGGFVLAIAKRISPKPKE